MKAQLASDGSQLRHVFLMTARVRRDEVGDNLLIQMFLAADTVELTLEIMELLE